MLIRPTGKWNPGVVEDDELNGCKGAEQIDQPPRGLMVVLQITPCHSLLKTVFAQRANVHVKPGPVPPP